MRRTSLFAAGAAVAIFAGSALAQNSTAGQPAKPAAVQPSSAAPAKAQPASPSAKPATPKIGDAVPDFTLKDTDGKEHKLSDLRGKIVVLEWFNPDCPVSASWHQASPDVMAETAKEFKDKNVVWLAINSGGAGKEGSGVERNAKARTEWKIEYPVLLDEPGTVGRAFGAKTTPHMFIVDAEGKLAYKGDIADQSNPSNNYVKQALTQMIAKETVTTPETPSHGCGVKYGAEPKKTH